MAAILYAADPPEARRRVSLDALDAIHHRPSGQTHLVCEPIPQILEALAAGPADAAGIVARLAIAHEFDPADAATIIAARLAELEAIGLLWRV
ncbi:HPr-rel-A system PqqD family peptide chaperone [Sphingobium boeckii]|uniref:PqqD family protein of HPr-rel-A system n=1 Tax=Sphingobium boeckii TaxID=1082345 RepID=A0A7W9AHJ4_9SPHN|nr:HPr-rel-A system PqqD family peptide chaperone [Sphingobium boeckii]MBB5685531.1 PqqD family protein of HPr-rel-A system [Sphingobium boeckii]